MRLGSIASVALISIGVIAGILSLPAIANSILLLTVFGGAGVLIGYKLKNLRKTLLWGLGGAGGAAWFYAFVQASVNWTLYHNSALVIDSLKIAVPIVLGTFAATFLVWARQEERHKTLLARALEVAFFAELIVTPFAIGGVLHYNVRADTSPPKAIQLIIVDKWRQYDSEEMEYIHFLKGETLDGSRQFSFVVTESHYNECNIGSLYEIESHNGALGYEWFDTYP